MPRVSTITKDQYKEITSQAAVASEILKDERFKFIRDYFDNASEYVEKSILENTIHDVREIVTMSDKVTRLFFTPKQLQIDELCGQYKFIKKFFDDLEQFIKIKEDVEEAIAKETVKIDDGKI